MPGTTFVNRDGFSNFYATIGAGSDSDTDISATCGGTLFSDVNRLRDVSNDPISPPARVPYSRLLEDVLVRALFAADLFYADNLPYTCNPELWENASAYNSNSYVAGLLKALGLRLPALSSEVLYVGWKKPVPASNFHAGH